MNFFICDVIGGFSLFFKIKLGVDNNSLVINDDNNIGIGILNLILKL